MRLPPTLDVGATSEPRDAVGCDGVVVFDVVDVVDDVVDVGDQESM